MAMLSRVAETIYWIGRYVERAENTARLLDVSLRSSRELATSFHLDEESPGELALILVATGEREEYQRRYGAVTEDGLATFLVVDRDNPNSVVSCLSAARGSARGVRESISSEMWEELNRAYLSFHRATSAYLLIEGLHDFCRQIRLASQLFQGVTDATMPRDEAWHFLIAGRYLERAGMTARILDARTGGLDVADDEAAPEEVHRWLALLRSVSAYESFKRLVPGGIQPAQVAGFLLFNLSMPRSVAFGIHQVREQMEAIDRLLGAAGGEGPAAIAAALGERLADSCLSGGGSDGLGDYLRLIIHDCGRIGESVRRTYFENVPAGLAAS
jgi:uncharacterized alpha-E superfamily protein